MTTKTAPAPTATPPTLTTSAVPDLADLIARLNVKLNAINIGNATSDNQKAAAYSLKRDISTAISGLMNPRDDQAERRVADWRERKAAHLAKREELEQVLEAEPDWRSFKDGRERDRQFDRLEHLRLQIKMLDAGTLLSGPNATYERLADIDTHIQKWEARITAARVTLESHVSNAERLLATK